MSRDYAASSRYRASRQTHRRDEESLQKHIEGKAHIAKLRRAGR